MPRPGPRPYECVRRAWHSERHQPMRGLIIREIFRLVHSNHSAATKKNKEWQENLPTVVLKVEEIMYSKANSEAEYSDLETVWNRANDAIDTIIRKDESTETGELLPPCVEAALNLACVPVRASRSQRHNNLHTYLRPRTQEPNDSSPKASGENRNVQNPNLWPPYSANASTSRNPAAVESPRLVSESNRRVSSNTNNPIAPLCEKSSSPANNLITPFELKGSASAGKVYPLYYGTDFQPEVSQVRLQESQEKNTIIVGVPIYSSVAEPAQIACLQSLFPCSMDKNVSKETLQAYCGDYNLKRPQKECDLSLRLSLFPDSYSSQDKGLDCVAHSSLATISQESARPRHKEFAFFPVETANDPSELRTSTWNREGEGQNMELVARKRKISASIGNPECFLLEDQSANDFVGRMKRPGL